MKPEEIRDESLLEVNGGKWTFETLTEDEKRRCNEVMEGLTHDWNYIEYNEFIREMNAKYGDD